MEEDKIGDAFEKLRKVIPSDKDDKAMAEVATTVMDLFEAMARDIKRAADALEKLSLCVVAGQYGPAHIKTS